MKSSAHFIDFGFAFIAVAGIAMIFKEPSSGQLVMNNWNPWIETGAALILATVMAACGVWGAQLDRRGGENHNFQLITYAAYIAMITTLLSHGLWDFSVLNERGLPKPTSGDMIGIMLLSWAMGYGFYRIRGLNP